MADSQSALQAAPTALKWAYSIVVIASVVPLGLAGSSWAAMVTGGGIGNSIPFVGPFLFLILGLYRTYLVARVPGTLASLPVEGFALTLRRIGVLCLYGGAVVSVLNLASIPLMRLLMTQRAGSGVGFLVVGVFLSVLGGIGVLGLLAFELSRLIGFEKRAGKHVHSHVHSPS